MRVLAVGILAALALSGCGTATGDRGLSGAGIGAGIGVIGGPPGMVVGGAVGAVAGMLSKPQQVNWASPLGSDFGRTGADSGRWRGPHGRSVCLSSFASVTPDNPEVSPGNLFSAQVAPEPFLCSLGKFRG